MSMTYKRFLTLVLALMMLVGIFSGCSDEPETAATTQPQASATETEPGSRVDELTPIEPVQITELTERQQLQTDMNRADVNSETKEYTLMIYMVGSDLESGQGSATADLMEMLNSQNQNYNK